MIDELNELRAGRNWKRGNTGRVALGLVLLAGGACGMPPREDAGKPSSVWGDPELKEWTLLAPELAIGGADERMGFALDRVAGALLLQDRLVVADAGFSELRFYSLSGELLSRSGRKGSGPGEYRVIRSVAHYGDSAVVVWEAPYQVRTGCKPKGSVIWRPRARNCS